MDCFSTARDALTGIKNKIGEKSVEIKIDYATFSLTGNYFQILASSSWKPHKEVHMIQVLSWRPSSLLSRMDARKLKINESMVRRWRRQWEELMQCQKSRKAFRGHKSRWLGNLKMSCNTGWTHRGQVAKVYPLNRKPKQSPAKWILKILKLGRHGVSDFWNIKIWPLGHGPLSVSNSLLTIRSSKFPQIRSNTGEMKVNKYRLFALGSVPSSERICSGTYMYSFSTKSVCTCSQFLKQPLGNTS